MDIDPTGITQTITSVSNLFSTLADKIWPNPADKAGAEAQLLMGQAEAAVDELKAQQAVMLAEAMSTDKWTSRARPGFLYVIYILILASMPMGIVSAISPDVAMHVITGFQAWLAAIPESMWSLFGTGYLGYCFARGVDKHGGIMPMITGKKAVTPR